MYPISNTVLALFQSGAMQYARLTIGSSTIANDRIKQGTFSINRYVETNESVAIGSCVAAEMVLVLDNYDGTYDNTDFVGSEAYVEIGVEDTNHTIQYIPQGYFTFDEATRTKNTVSLAALDRMTKFDIVVNASQLSFPYTLTNLLDRICTLCGVTKGTFTLTNASYSVASLPSEAKTYRDLLRWICEVSGSNAYISYDGKLYLGWYGTTSQFNILPSNRTSSDLDKNTFSITGVTILTGDNQKYTAGTNTRPITITNNPFITTTQAQSVATTLNTKLGGFSYCPFTAVMLPSPMIFPMDRATFTTAEGTSVAVSVSEVTYKLNGSTAIACKGEMQVRGRSYGLADQTFYASNIAAGAVTADKISVTDLNALGATIAGWNIGQTSINKTVLTPAPYYSYTTELNSGRYPFLSERLDGAHGINSRFLIDAQEMRMELRNRIEATDEFSFATVDGHGLDTYQREYESTMSYFSDGRATYKYDGVNIYNNEDIDLATKWATLTDEELSIGGTTTARLTNDDITFSGNSLKRLTPHLTATWSTRIPNGADLNTTTYLAVGNYYTYTSVDAASLSNCPTYQAFSMKVEANIQTEYDNEGTTGSRYRVRTIVDLVGAIFVQYITREGSNAYVYSDWMRMINHRFLSNNNINDITASGTYICGSYVTNSARTWVGMIACGDPKNLQRGVHQLQFNSGGVHVRSYTGSPLAWSAWKRLAFATGGDTFSGGVYTTGEPIQVLDATTERNIAVKSKAGGGIYIDYAANGDHGLFSNGYETSMTDSSTFTASGSWLIYRNSAGYVRIPWWAGKGNATTPIYFDGDGYPAVGANYIPRISASTTDASTGWIKIKINSTTTWMLSFVITIYSGYHTEKILVCGYNYYATGKWYDPKARLIESTNKTTVEVRFGYDSANNLWVAIPADYYYGILISDVTNGYTQVAYNGLFSISFVSSTGGTTQEVVYAGLPKTTTATRNTTNTGSTATSCVIEEKNGLAVSSALGFTLTSAGTANGATLFTGLPKPAKTIRFVMYCPQQNKAMQCIVDTSGNLKNDSSSGVASYAYYGQVMYYVDSY